jgi:hypothetical protein
LGTLAGVSDPHIGAARARRMVKDRLGSKPLLGATPTISA